MTGIIPHLKPTVMRKTLLLISFISFLLVPAIPFASTPVPTTTDPLTEEQRKVARAAFEDLSNMPRKERMQKLKQAKKELRKYKLARKKKADADTSTILLVILAILLPPLAVYLHEQETNTKFWITLLLFLLGIAGAVFFSWLLIFASIVYALIVILGD